MKKTFFLSVVLLLSLSDKSSADTYQIYMPSTMPGMLATAPAQFFIVNTDSRSTVTVDTEGYLDSFDISNWSFAQNDFVQVDGTALNSGRSNERIFQEFKGSSMIIRENGLVSVRDKGPDGIKAGDVGDTLDDGENRIYDRILTINTSDGTVSSQTLIASNLSDYNHAVANGYTTVLEDKSATPDQLATMELFKMTTYSENLTNSGSMVGDAIETQGSFSTTKITDAGGVSLFRKEDDGSIHIGENSVVIVDSPNSLSGHDMIYSSAADGSILQIGNIDSHRTIINGTLEVTDESSFQGAINMQANRITGLGTPLQSTDAVNKAYTDTLAASTLTSANSYTDTVAASTLTSANSYTDTVAASTLTSANSYTDTVAASTLTSANSFTDTLANNLYDGIEDSSAMGAALSALPNSAPDALAYCGGGFGAYGNSQALAMGCASNLNEKVSLNFGASVLSTGGTTVNNRDFDDYSFKAGVTYKFGVDASKSKSAKTAALEAVVFKQQSDLQSMTAREAYKDTKIAEYEDRIIKLEEAKLADAAEYNNRLAKLEERFQLLTVAVKEENNKFAGLVK
jgi:hypothetical protein